MYFTHFHKNGDVETVWHPSTGLYLDYFSGENLPLAAAYRQLHEDVKALVDNLGIAGNMPAGVDHVIDPAVGLRDSIIRFLHAVSKHPHAEDFRRSTLMPPHEPADREYRVHYDTTKDPLTMHVEVDELIQLRMRDELGLFYDGAHRTDVPRRTDLGVLPAPRTHKRRLYGRQEGNCAGCGEHFRAQHLEVDHIIARNKGGTDHIENLQLLCGSCNRIKGDRGMEYLRVKLQL